MRMLVPGRLPHASLFTEKVLTALQSLPASPHSNIATVAPTLLYSCPVQPSGDAPVHQDCRFYRRKYDAKTLEAFLTGLRTSRMRSCRGRDLYLWNQTRLPCNTVLYSFLLLRSKASRISKIKPRHERTIPRKISLRTCTFTWKQSKHSSVSLAMNASAWEATCARQLEDLFYLKRTGIRRTPLRRSSPP